MSYTPPNTFVAGTAISAADVQGNIDAIQDYANDQIPSGDLAATAWCRQQHIVSPEYNPTTQTIQMVSGSVSESERPRFTSRYTYAQRVNSNSAGAVTAWQWVPGTVQQFIVPRSARALFLQFQFSGTTGVLNRTNITPAVAQYGQPVTIVRAFLTASKLEDIGQLNGLGDLDQFTEHRIQPEAERNSGTPLDESFSAKASRDHHSGCILKENVGAGVYTFGLATQSTHPKFRIWRWNVVTEAWMV